REVWPGAAEPGGEGGSMSGRFRSEPCGCHRPSFSFAAPLVDLALQRLRIDLDQRLSQRDVLALAHQDRAHPPSGRVVDDLDLADGTTRSGSGDNLIHFRQG